MIKELIKMAVLVAFAFIVFRGLDWVIPAPPTKVLVCIEDQHGEHNCRDYTDNFNDRNL